MAVFDETPRVHLGDVQRVFDVMETEALEFQCDATMFDGMSATTKKAFMRIFAVMTEAAKRSNTDLGEKMAKLDA